MSYRFKILARNSALTIIHHVFCDGTLWATSGRTVLCSLGAGWQPVTRFPFAAPRDFFGWSRPTARAMRADKCNLFVNRAGRVLGIRSGWVYALADQNLQRLFPIQGDCVLHGGICEDDDGWSYFGEYFMNPERKPVRIWRVDETLSRWETAHEFPAGKIRHVHGVYRDPYDSSALWCTVGDYAGECFLVRTRDRFQTLDWFGDGKQLWRAVHLFFTPEHVCWLTDSNLEPNHACRMSRRDGWLETGQALDCSGWYGTTTREGLHVAFTTVERGPAIRRKESSVLVSRDAFRWEEVFSFKKDFYRPMQVFKYGVISCPAGMMSADDLWISGEGLVGLDGASLRVSITEGE